MWKPKLGKPRKITEKYRRELIEMGMAETQHELDRNKIKESIKRIIKK